jgi:hypothetical protein
MYGPSWRESAESINDHLPHTIQRLDYEGKLHGKGGVRDGAAEALVILKCLSQYMPACVLLPPRVALAHWLVFMRGPFVKFRNPLISPIPEKVIK